jgi:ribonuclease BN (tRNA processing enzyme)
MQMTIVGSADAFNADGFGHSAYWLEADGAGPIMVDFGATSLARVRQLGLRASALRGIAITHLHGDHVGGIPFLVIDALYNDRRTTPLEIVGPIGTRARLAELLEVTYGKAAWLDGVVGRLVELPPGASAELGGFTIHGFRAEHMDPPDVPLCLRVEAPSGRSIAFSGDTELCDGLFEASAGADLLVAECTMMQPPAGRHVTWQGWRDEGFARVRAARLMLTHLGTDVRARRAELLAEAPPALGLSFAEDGLRVTA